MDPQLVLYVILPLAGVSICFAAVLVILIKDHSRVSSYHKTGGNESQRLKTELGRLKDEAARMKDELTAKEARLVQAGNGLDKLKLATDENERLKDVAGRLQAELAEARRKEGQGIKGLEEMRFLTAENKRLKEEVAHFHDELDRSKLEGIADVADLEAMLIAKAEVERLQDELKQKNEELGELKLRTLADIKPPDQTATRKAEAAAAYWEQEAARLGKEIQEMKEAYREYESHIARLKETEPGIAAIETSLAEEKKAFSRLEESARSTQKKIQLLQNKTKEAAEAIAAFAGGKEFDEFRKAAHLDETIAKYESDLRELKAKNAELEKKAGFAGAAVM